ncbi:nucleotidyltransferase [Apibacter mensalis]|uniref:nucleotidyltransferase n=1 Tax=Apibacter mensalis TaxID=1586267 RepID=UPI0026F287BD|nr:nucleotidyltransferase [Apibacter mensalis]
MARKLTDIKAQIVSEKTKYSELDVLNSKSKSSIWNLFIYIIAYAIFNLELLFDQHKLEVSTAISELKPHTARWYRNKAIAFQYGFDLYEDSDKFNNENHTIEEIEKSKVVKYSAVTEAESLSRLIIKIAGEENGELAPITEPQKEAFIAYMDEIKDAGVPLTIINYLPDLLYLSITIKRDPLVLDSSGNAISPINGDIRPIETSIKQFLMELPFNGELFLSKLTDRIQTTAGVKDVNIDSASSAWIDPNVNDYGHAQGIYMSKIPESGYFTTKDKKGNQLININYVV